MGMGNRGPDACHKLGAKSPKGHTGDAKQGMPHRACPRGRRRAVVQLERLESLPSRLSSSGPVRRVKPGKPLPLLEGGRSHRCQNAACLHPRLHDSQRRNGANPGSVSGNKPPSGRRYRATKSAGTEPTTRKKAWPIKSSGWRATWLLTERLSSLSKPMKVVPHSSPALQTGGSMCLLCKAGVPGAAANAAGGPAWSGLASPLLSPSSRGSTQRLTRARWLGLPAHVLVPRHCWHFGVPSPKPWPHLRGIPIRYRCGRHSGSHPRWGPSPPMVHPSRIASGSG
ncbi:hypothetical protein GQ53DRAFT_390792 [Thozetella sp. PMI_491]|nr:hypothetical protein GQ53DRAFT_390792 [Thozetella sp. PMI_491]